MASVDEEVKLTGRSRKVKNLEKEVELILSQDESDAENNCDANKQEITIKSPSASNKIKEVSTPKASQAMHNELLQTPRRSCRKSVKPTQDYDDIVNRSLRICTRSGKKNLPVTMEELLEVDANKENETDHHKWTPAKVGRVSQKRGRKSRRNGKGKLKVNESHIETEELDTSKENKNLSQELINVFPENEDQNKEKSESPSKTTSNTKLENLDGMREEHNEKSIRLIQEDSEDAKGFIQKSSEEDICIVFENNISNEESKAEKEENVGQFNRENIEDSCFGSYLKTKRINISDLGLNPIKDEDDEIKENTESSSQDAEEMPSLIVCDEDDEEEKDNNNKRLNETFEANDHLELVKNEDLETMETLEISDDESTETPKKLPRIVLTNTSMQNQTLLSTPKVKMPPTPKTLSTPKMLTTPKQSVKAYRFPTPYRTEKNLKFTRGKIVDNDKLITEKTSDTSTLSLTTLQPKEIVLRSIRKRSLSVCIDGNDNGGKKFLPDSSKKLKLDRMVSFYSPANQTAIIDDLDIIIAKSLKRQKAPQQTKGALNNNVTTRRKRSISLDESMMSSQISKLPRPVIKQNVNQTTSSKPLMRTKLPNFAAIHQKNFKKMENLVDHINRKQERSKNLINSATKLKTVSAQKNVSIMKNSSFMEKSKAVKKIDLGKAEINKINVSASIAVTTVNRAQDILNAEKINKLPDPRMGLPIAVKTGGATQGPNKQPQIDKYLKTTQKSNIEKIQPISKTTTNSSAAVLKPSFNLSTTLTNNQDKMTSRLQRHMDLFKARDGVAARKKDILRGVRSNRRFELQMQHRRNMDQ